MVWSNIEQTITSYHTQNLLCLGDSNQLPPLELDSH